MPDAADDRRIGSDISRLDIGSSGYMRETPLVIEGSTMLVSSSCLSFKNSEYSLGPHSIMEL